LIIDDVLNKQREIIYQEEKKFLKANEKMKKP